MLIMRKPFESLECRDGLYAVVDYRGREYCFTTILNSCMILFTRILLGGTYDILDVTSENCCRY
jgi:hypothetical protein